VNRIVKIRDPCGSGSVTDGAGKIRHIVFLACISLSLIGLNDIQYLEDQRLHRHVGTRRTKPSTG
jgi:hypothetical protein